MHNAELENLNNSFMVMCLQTYKVSHHLIGIQIMFDEALKKYRKKFGTTPAIALGRGNDNEIAIALIEAVESNTPLPILTDPNNAEL